MCNKVIGIDISKLTFDVAYLDDGKWRNYIFSNDLNGFKSLLKLLGKNDHCVMEASGPYYLQLASFLYQKEVLVSVVNPLTIKRFSQMRLVRAKTDKKDAQVISSYGLTEQPNLWKPSSEISLQMQQINTLLEAIQKQRTALTNQSGAFVSSGIIDPQVKRSLKSMIQTLIKEQEKLELRLERLVSENFHSTYLGLTSIPGIGKKGAIMLIAITDNFEKFTNYKQLIAYVGFSPRIFQSGTSVRGKAHICKMGKSQIRRVLYMCSWSAKRCNKACVEMYERLKAKGKPERVVKIAIANKLLKQAFSIATNKSQYTENYMPKPCF